MPLGQLVPLGRFGASWNNPLTVGDILYTPAGRIMRDERSLVTVFTVGDILYTPAERFLGDERLPANYTPLFSECSDRYWR